MSDPESPAAAADAIPAGRPPINPLADALRHYPTLGRERFHVPGHAGRGLFDVPGLTPDAFAHDLSEVEGLDVLSEPEGCIAEAQARAARLFGVAHSFFLVNGASVGLQAAMLAGLHDGDRVLVPRNAHRAVISGLVLSGAEPVWLLPQALTGRGLWGPVAPEAIERALHTDPGIRMVIVTSPTYEGIASDVAAIAVLCRQHNALLLIDEAHGSLWPLSERLPTSGCHVPADAVVHAMHKSAGSLTQTALLHRPHDSRLTVEALQQAINTLQTTSPSYLLLASLDAACGYLASAAGQACVDATITRALGFRERLRSAYPRLQLDDAHGLRFDPMACFVQHPKRRGDDWGPWLEQAHRLAYESVSPSGVLYKLGLGLEPEALDALIAGLEAFSREPLSQNATISEPEAFSSWALPQQAMTPRQAMQCASEPVSRHQATGRVAAETIVHCPPGIPVLIPGEQIDAAKTLGLPEIIHVVCL